MKFDQHDIDAFAARLADARAAKGLPRRALVDAVEGISEPQQIYNYEKGRRAPDRVAVVVGLEHALDLPNGTLCRLLGFAPLAGELEPPAVEDAISADTALTREAKLQLLSAYRRVAQVPPRLRH